MPSNIVGWFEIPVTDMDRAITFYEKVLDVKLDRNRVGTLDMAWFPYAPEGYGSGGSLVCQSTTYRPSADGVVVYLSSPTGDLKNEIARVDAAGGKVVQEKTIISEEHGFMAVLMDSEGNRVALHSKK